MDSSKGKVGMDMGFNIGTQGGMKGSGGMIELMVMESFSIMMVIFIKVNGKMINYTGMVYINQEITFTNMRVSGL